VSDSSGPRSFVGIYPSKERGVSKRPKPRIARPTGEDMGHAQN